MKSIVVACVAVSWCWMSLAPARAQCPQWSPSFSAGGFDDFGYALYPFDDGSGAQLYGGGIFITAGDGPAARVARFDGETWLPMSTGMDSGVRAFGGYDDGSGLALYAGGAFTTAGGVPCNRIAKWDGASWSPVGSGLSAAVNALIAFDDGSGLQLYAGGEFIPSGSNTLNRVARWNGSTWTSVGTGLAGSGGYVDALCVFDDGSGPALYAGGKFTGGVAKWNGSSWSTLGGGTDARVFALGVFDDGSGAQLYAGGEFGVAGGNFSPRVARWNGTSWSAVPGVATASQFVRTLHVYDDGGGALLYVGGDFSVTGLTGGSDLVRWNGSSWSAMPGAQNPNSTVRSLATFDSGSGPELVATGQFTKVGTQRAQRVGMWNGTSWRTAGARQPVQPSLISNQDGVLALTQWTDPTDHRDLVIVGGRIVSAGNVAVQNVAGWDGVGWRAFGSGTSAPRALIGYDDPVIGHSVLVAAGGSTSRWDGTSWAYLTNPPLPDVTSLAVWREPGNSYDSLFAGGTFAGLADLTAMTYIARWDGVQWTRVDNGMDDVVYAMAVYDPPGATPESLFVTGAFNNASFTHAEHFARWDGTAWSAVPTTNGNPLRSLIVYDEGVGIGEALYGAEKDGGLWRFDGTSWTLLAANVFSSGECLSIAGFDDGTGPAIYTAVGVRWRNSALEPFGDGGQPTLTAALLTQHDDQGADRAVFFGGKFETFGGYNARCFARWSNPCATLTSYCTPKINSQGCTPAIGWNGEPSISASTSTPFEITASNVLNIKSGILFYGIYGRAAVPFQGGKNCVHSPVRRTPLRSSGGNVGPDDCSGVYTIDFTPWIDGTDDPLLDIGVTVDAQWWSRDPASPSTTGLTDAIEFEIRP